MSKEFHSEPINWRAALRTGGLWLASAIFVVALGLVAAYELVITITVYDGVSADSYDAGNRFALAIIFILSIPAFIAVFGVSGLLLRWRFRMRSLLVLLVPVIVWAVILIVRTVSSGCSAALAKC